MSDNHSERRETTPLGIRACHQHQRSGPIRNRARVRRRHRSVFAKGRFQQRNLVRRSLGRLFVLVDDALAALAGHSNGRNFPCERAVVVGIERPRERCQRELILRLAREAEFRRAVLGECSHQATLLVSVLEPIQEHVVLHDLMSHPITAPRLRHQIRGIRHAFHSAGDNDVARAGSDLVVRKHRRFHRGAAHLVDRRAARRERQARFQCRLPRRRLTLPRRQHIAHDRFLHVVRTKPSALDRRLDHYGAQIAGGKRRKVALHRTHRRARCTDDDDWIIQHGNLLHILLTSRNEIIVVILPTAVRSRRRARLHAP